MQASSAPSAAPPSSGNDDDDDDDNANNNNNNNSNSNSNDSDDDDDDNSSNDDDVDNDWESYAMSVPQGTNAAGYSLIVYDRETCTGVNATLTALQGNFPDNVDDDVESYRICPPGVAL